MINHRDFHLSDWVAQNNPGWRVRWGPQTEFMTLIVDLASPREDSHWRLFWCDEDPHIVLNRDGKFVPVTEAEVVYVAVNKAGKSIPVASGLRDEKWRKKLGLSDPDKSAKKSDKSKSKAKSRRKCKSCGS